ncbi:3165_t:CDS:2, partial [Funneliformis caledonium]
ISDAITSILVTSKLSYFNLRHFIEVALTLDEGVWCRFGLFGMECRYSKEQILLLVSGSLGEFVDVAECV